MHAMEPRRLHSVGEVATLAGVTVRTLHHYDRIGLLVPSGRSGSGYRLYAYDDLERLREIRLLRELGFSLGAIGDVLDAPAYDRRRALVAQRTLLVERRRRTERIIRGVERALQAIDEEKEMDTTEMFDGLEDFDYEQYEAEVKERWGDSDAYRESRRRTRAYGKTDLARIAKDGDALVARLAELLARGARADGAEAMDLAEEYRCYIDRWFFPCTHGMHRELAAVYTADPRFEAHFERRAKGLAVFFQTAVGANEIRWTNAS